MRFQLVVNGEPHDVEVSDGRASVDGRPVRGEATPEGTGVTVRIGGKRYLVLLTRWGAVINDVPYRVEVREIDVGAFEGAGVGARRAPAGRIDVRPPMPGRIVRVRVKEGQRVSRGDSLIVLEAMKMQNEIPAPAAGIIREVRVREGQTVLAADVLVVLDPE